MSHDDTGHIILSDFCLGTLMLGILSQWQHTYLMLLYSAYMYVLTEFPWWWSSYPKTSMDCYHHKGWININIWHSRLHTCTNTCMYTLRCVSVHVHAHMYTHVQTHTTHAHKSMVYSPSVDQKHRLRIYGYPTNITTQDDHCSIVTQEVIWWQLSISCAWWQL